MFYDPRSETHGLPHDPFKSCIAPRPIGWISSQSEDGVINLAPYSFFNAVADDPPTVVFATTGDDVYGLKHSISNIEATGQFVCNIATWDLREQLNKTSAPVPAEVDEMQFAGLTAAPSQLVRPPRVAEAPIHLECEHYQTIDLPFNGKGRNSLCIGHVVGIHISESVLTDGLVDMAKLRPIARLGYHEFTSVESVFKMTRPTAKDI